MKGPRYNGYGLTQSSCSFNSVSMLEIVVQPSSSLTFSEIQATYSSSKAFLVITVHLEENWHELSSK